MSGFIVRPGEPVLVDFGSLPQTRIRRHYAELGGAPGAEVSGPEQSGPGDRIRYQNGAIYVGQNSEPAWVYGAIGQRYDGFGAGAGWLGLPMNDETGTPDGRGRYNHFEHGSIYWTPTTGAFEVHGAIRDKWAALGWERSGLGYPVTDEAGTPGGNGRYNRFERGSIFWTPASGAYDVPGPALPTPITGHADIAFSDSTPVGGWADITLNSDGSFVFSGHLHDSSSVLDFSDSVLCVVVVKSTSTAYTFAHNGRVSGPGVFSSAKNDDWPTPGTRPELAFAWPDLCAGYEIHFITRVDWDPAGWIETIKALYPYVQAVVALL